MAIDKVGQDIAKGFYVPSSQSSSYVANKRNKEGSYDYTSKAQNVGIERQAALQNLSEQYGDIVNNAYASYLANQRTINAAAMGQGYKDAYNQMQNEALQETIAQAGLSAKNARQQLDTNALQAREQLDEQFALETANLDKVGTSLDNYFEYLKGLVNTSNGKSYFETMGINYDEKTRARDIYNELYNSTAYMLNEDKTPMFKDTSGNAALGFADYVNANLGTKQADTDWRDWLFYKGGWEEYVDALNKSKDEKPYITQKQEALEKIKEELKIDDTVDKVEVKDKTFELNGKNYTIKNRLNDSELTKLYDYFKGINKKLNVGDVIKVGNKQYIYSDIDGQNRKGLYEVKEIVKKDDYYTWARKNYKIIPTYGSKKDFAMRKYREYLNE